MNLPRPSPSYDSQDQARTRAELQRADSENYKHGADVEITSAQRLIMTDVHDNRRYVVTLNNGTFTFTAL